MQKEMCNLCGVPASKFKNRACFACNPQGCSMSSDSLIEMRAYTYAKKAGLLPGGTHPYFDAQALRIALESSKTMRTAPKYFRAAVSCEGLSYASLDDFPTGIVLRVCHDSDNGELIVGELVWRDPAHTAGVDVLNVVQGMGSMSAAESAEALKGAQFEHTQHTAIYERGQSHVKI